ncbi:hypothetical protein QVD17_41636 [Tagetes erecta]|uniref:Uncharacterized protein n=1 Tax=Tagetes erecta TaxID=13708 RepID=A0AAD8JKU2_TARER|nr:hypothetical protein QVD17_41636 [Tagetes erecta]
MTQLPSTTRSSSTPLSSSVEEKNTEDVAGKPNRSDSKVRPQQQNKTTKSDHSNDIDNQETQSSTNITVIPPP